MMKEKKRLAIFSFYDSEGIVDSFIEFLLKDLNEVATELVIVINGFVCHEGYQILSKYTKNIVIRDNIGFDIGAFKLGYEKYCINSRENQWDEIIFCNDTFYGPLKSFQDIFKYMENKKSDFWGLNLLRDGMFTHLQSFFLVFRNKKIIQSTMEEYFNDQTIKMLIMSSSVEDIYSGYELGIFKYFTDKGYTYATYTDTGDYDIYQKPDICMKEYGLPIIKRKCFMKNMYNKQNVMKALNLIKELQLYDINLILQNAMRKYSFKLNEQWDSTEEIKEVKSKAVEESCILDFVKMNSKIYIYGTGVYARKVWFLVHDKISDFCGFIISDNQIRKEEQLYGEPIKYYSMIDKNCSIIIGCDKSHTEQILKNISHSGNIFILWK